MRRTRDLEGLCTKLAGLSWKVAPRADLLSKFSDLIKLILSMEPRSILSDAMLKAAILETDAEDCSHIHTCILHSDNILLTA